MTYQAGFGNLPIYTGSRYQVGGGLLSTLKGIAFPLAKRFGGVALKTAAKHLPRVAEKMVRGQNASDALKEVGKNIVSTVGSEAARQAISHAPPMLQSTLTNVFGGAGGRKRKQAAPINEGVGGGGGGRSKQRRVQAKPKPKPKRKQSRRVKGKDIFNKLH